MFDRVPTKDDSVEMKQEHYKKLLALFCVTSYDRVLWTCHWCGQVPEEGLPFASLKNQRGNRKYCSQACRAAADSYHYRGKENTSKEEIE